MNYLSNLLSAAVFACATTAAFASSTIISSAAPAVTIDAASGFQSGTIAARYVFVNSRLVQVTKGTTAYSQQIVVNGVTRRFVVIRPDPQPATDQPLVILLHPSDTTPEAMANLTLTARYSLTQGFWAAFPEAIDGKWKDDPTTSDDSDVRFISSLIDTLSGHGVDGSQVFATGYSSGGFFTERLACQLSDKIAAFGIVAATMKGALISSCNPAILRSKAYFLGTADTVVPFAGISSGAPLGLDSAQDSLTYWAGRQSCGGILTSSLPNLDPNDGTTVQKAEYSGCASGTSLQLYTIYNGGHTWPGGIGQSPNVVGATSQDIQATGLAWLAMHNARR